MKKPERATCEHKKTTEYARTTEDYGYRGLRQTVAHVQCRDCGALVGKFVAWIEPGGER
jgi:hypothetical protein